MVENVLRDAQTIRVAVIQHPPVFLNLDASVRKAIKLIEQAADEGASDDKTVRIMAFPETFLPGYPVWLDNAPNAALWNHPPANALYRLLVENAITIPGPHLDALLRAAANVDAYVVMGAHEKQRNTLYNTTLYLDKNGRDFAIHRKLMPTYTEKLIWGRGDGSTLSTLDTPFGVLGGLICWEHWMPLARAAMHAKGEVVHVAQWPAVRELHQVASRHYAFEGQCFVLAAGTVLRRGDVLEGFRSLGRPDHPAGALLTSEILAGEILAGIPGDDDTVLQNGGSAIIGPDASYIAGPLWDEPGILTAGLDLNAIAEGHLLMDADGHYSRPDIFQLHVDTRPHTHVKFT